jgi:hypothetical protein
MKIDNLVNIINRFFFNMDPYSDLREINSEVLRVIWMDDCLQRVSYVIKLHGILLALNYTSFGVNVSNDSLVGGYEASRT